MNGSWSTSKIDRWGLGNCSLYVIPSSSRPSPTRLSHPYSGTPLTESMLYQKVQSLLSLGAMEEIHQEHKGKGFYSHYCLIPKKKGSGQPILNLRQLNTFICKLKFRMVILASVIPCLDQNNRYIALDFPDTYFHIAIPPAHRRYLRFHVGNCL